MIETYIVTKNNYILIVYQTSQGIDGINKSLQFENIKDYDEIIQVPNEFEGLTGMNYKEIDENGKLKPFEQRVLEGLQPVPKGFKIVDNKLVKKTLKEKINDGDIKLASDEIYDEELNQIRPKKPEEKYTPEELAIMEREKLIQEKIREMAINALKSEGML